MVFKVSLEFETINELVFFLVKNNFLKKEEIVETNPNEKRGSLTYLLHQSARIIKSNNPELSYKTCLKMAGNNRKKNNI
jgi:hypothetical protein